MKDLASYWLTITFFFVKLNIEHVIEVAEKNYKENY